MTRLAAPRVELVLGPTPLLRLERLSRELGVELWLKRDDLTGLLESGNKVRKLEFLVGEALAERADTLVTGGTPQSNGCRTVAAVAARLGMKAVLALRGVPPAEYDGNLLLDHVLGAEVHHGDVTLERLAEDVRARGGRPYVIPEGGATVAGALGYLVCGNEIVQQIRHGAPDFDAIVITAFTGGSHAGLLMAKQLTGLRAEIVSVPVAWDAGRVRDSVTSVLEHAAERYRLAVSPPATIELLDGCQGAGGSAVSDEDLRTVTTVAQREGIVLDPGSTAKAFGGLVEAVRRDGRRFGRRICFIHTGGIFGVFPFRAGLRRVLDEDNSGALVNS